MKYLIACLLLDILPPTRFFAAKRILLRLLGIVVGPRTRVCGRVKFYGAGKVVIGADCWIGIGTKFYTSVGADVIIGDRCDIAPEVAFMCGSHTMGNALRRAGTGRAGTIRVGEGCWLGIRATLLGGTEVGKSCVVGASSLLLEKSYPPSSLIVGVPASVTRSLDG
jgi:maltose O-acetyltransferase